MTQESRSTGKTSPDSLNRLRLEKIVSQLGDLSDSVVFIGGVVTELLQTIPILPKARPTDDVDAIVGVSSEIDYQSLGIKLKQQGFREDTSEGTNRFRWISPTGTTFDLVPAKLTGNKWDQLALDKPVRVSLSNGMIIRHVRGPVFLAMKWTAFIDRGNLDWMASRDFEDMIAVLAARPTILAEITEEGDEVQDYLAEASRTMLSTNDIESYVLGTVSNSLLSSEIVESVMERLRAIARLRTT